MMLAMAHAACWPLPDKHDRTSPSVMKNKSCLFAELSSSSKGFSSKASPILQKPPKCQTDPVNSEIKLLI